MSDRTHTQEEIRSRAYHLWQQRGCPWGTPDTDWFNAERELTEIGLKGGLLQLARDLGSAAAIVVAAVTGKPESSA